MNFLNKYNDVKSHLLSIYNRQNLPNPDDYANTLNNINSVLLSEDEQFRPHDASDMPGGLVYLKKNIPTIIVPDIHARMDFIINIMLDEDADKVCNLQKIISDELQIVCVGDGVHGEKRAAKRWANAYKEFESDFAAHENIDEEMKESLGTMEMIMEVKSAFPQNFHFLKGNHENIKNEEGGGNYPFVKFSYEGPIVAYYMKKFYGDDFLNLYSQFEKNLPLLAVGRNFIVSHSEPASFFKKEELINYRQNAEIVEGLTWTADDAADDGSVSQMLEYYIENESDKANSFYFGGHRPVKNLYNLRAGGKYIQLHNPDKFIIALIGLNGIDLERDIVEIENNTESILERYINQVN